MMLAPPDTALRQLAVEMMEIFPSSQRAHATYEDTGKRRDSDSKAIVKYETVREAVTPELWMQHFTGKRPLVIGLACDDGTSRVSCVDVDDYFKVDRHELVNRIKNLGLPLYVRASKSGGAHVLAFHDEFIPIEQAREVARGMARKLGLGDNDKNEDKAEDSKVEFFPKPQSPNPEKLPRGLNMPYLGGQCGIITPGSKVCGEMLIDRFLHSVVRLTAEQRAALLAVDKKQEPTADDGRRYAATQLKRYADELAAMPLGDRNNRLNERAFHMGTMIAREWIEREEVEQTIRTSIAQWDDQPKTLDTLTRALDDGGKQPHADLHSAGTITEDSVALEFAERHASDLRFDHDVGSWFRWTGKHWARDKTKFAFAEARDLAREHAEGKKARTRLVISKASFAGSVERYAQADQTLAVTQDVWDRDAFLLGTPGGTVDLRTGKLREARHDDYITKQAACAPIDTADCPIWKQFLCEVTSRDAELANFLQLVCGYSMTGETREHLLLFVYGPGGNGKSVFLTTVAGVLGDYATVAAMDTFTETRGERHPADLAMLRGARLVTSAETSEGKAWAETRIKQLTGGDPVTARFMRRDFFTYQPQFQLIISGNHKPDLRNITDAFRRRLAIAPFTYQPREKLDPELTTKLRQEWPGILRWMMDGCLRWQAGGGIPRPEVVRETTKEYFEEQDMFGQWIEECVERKLPTAKETTKRLFGSWSAYCRARNEDPGNEKSFKQQMVDHGFEKAKIHGLQGYKGLSLKPDQESFSNI